MGRRTQAEVTVRERALPGLMALMLCACSDSLAPAPFAELCGGVGPFHLLPLAPDERPVPEDSIIRIGERIVLAVGSGESMFGSLRGPGLATTTIYALGSCGEDPVIIGRDIDRLSMASQWPGVVFGCDTATDDLIRLDPSGVVPPESLAVGACGATWTPDGLVHVEGMNPLRVVFHPYLAPTELHFGPPVVLKDDIPFGPSILDNPTPLIDGALVLEPNGVLVHIDLEGSIRPEQSGVRYFGLSENGRFMIWQGLISEDPDGDFPPGDIFVRDRETGTEVFVIHAYLPPRNGNALFPEPDAIQITLGETLGGQWLIELPTFTLHQIPAGRQLSYRVGDGRWLVRSALFGPYLLRDLESGSETPVAGLKGYPFGDPTDFLDLLEASGNINFRSTRRLIRFSYGGGEPQVLASRANRGSYFLPDGRIVSPVEIAENWIGDLIVTDPETQQELQIDDHVVAALDLEAWHGAFGPDVVAYSVTDGERSGVWLARPE